MKIQTRLPLAGLLGMFMLVSASGAASETAVRVYAAGSLKMPLQEAAEVFASANMENPEALAREGLAGPVTRFARNRICALARAETLAVSEDTLTILLDPKVRLGTSTPKSDRCIGRFAGSKSTAEMHAEKELTKGPNRNDFECSPYQKAAI